MAQVTPEGYARVQAHFAKTQAMNEAKQAVIDAARALRDKAYSLSPMHIEFDTIFAAVKALEKLEAA